MKVVNLCAWILSLAAVLSACAPAAPVSVESPAVQSSGDTVATATADPQNSQTLYLWEEGNVPAVTEYTHF